MKQNYEEKLLKRIKSFGRWQSFALRMRMSDPI